MSSGSSRIAGFTGVRLGDCDVHPGSLGSLVCFLVVVVFICGRYVRWGAPWFVSVLRGHWVNRGAPWGPSGSAGVVGFTGERPRGCRFR